VELAVGEVADARVPLDAVTVEAEEVRRLDRGRGVPRACGAVDDRLGRVLLRVIRDRDRFVAGQGADHDVRAELLQQPPRFLDRGVRPVVRAADPDELERMPTNLPAGPSRRRLVRVLQVAAGELRERRLRAADVGVVERAERALAVGQDRDLDRRRRRALAGRGADEGCGQRHRSGEDAQPGREPEPGPSLSDVNHSLPSLCSFREAG
jgi:hypothetical protein